jgi:arabinan endo-1,5-alpha-L-arabinosidase
VGEHRGDGEHPPLGGVAGDAGGKVDDGGVLRRQPYGIQSSGGALPGPLLNGPAQRELRHVLAVAGTLALGASAITWQVADAATVDPAATYQLVSRLSGKALAVQGASTADGAQIVQLTTDGSSTSQQWQFVDSGGGYYRLRAVHSGKVVDIEAHSTADGAKVEQWTDNNATNQQFMLVDSDSGYFRLINRNSGKALDVWNRSTADGAIVSQYTDGNATNQQWQLVRVGSTPPTTSPPTKTITIPNTLGTHDPSRIINDNGSYYFYSTGSNIPVWYTNDGRTWKQGPAVFPNGLPSWQKTLVPENDGHLVWAPDIIYRNGLFYLYYAVNGGKSSAIGLATSPTLNPSASNHKWTDRGAVLSNGPNDRVSAIDPAPFIDASGNFWLSWGSGYIFTWSDPEIFVTRLDNSTGLRAAGAADNPVVLGHVEASYVQYHNGYYYLFWNTGGCCSGASSTYLIHVARSASVTGPYVDKSGTAGGSNTFLASHGSVHGPGHLGILSQNGVDYYTYHYYPDSGGSVLGLGTITWGSDGWPAASEPASPGPRRRPPGTGSARREGPPSILRRRLAQHGSQPRLGGVHVQQRGRLRQQLVVPLQRVVDGLMLVDGGVRDVALHHPAPDPGPDGATGQAVEQRRERLVAGGHHDRVVERGVVLHQQFRIVGGAAHLGQQVGEPVEMFGGEPGRGQPGRGRFQ